MKAMKKAVTLVALGAITMLASCRGTSSDVSNKSSSAPASDTSTPSPSESEFTVEFKGQTFTADGSASVDLGDNAAILSCSMTDGSAGTFSFTSSDSSVINVTTQGKVSPLKAGTADVTITDAGNASIKISFTVKSTSVSSGGISYVSESYEEKARILAALEKYTVDNYLTGITIFSDGSKIAYNDRYVPQCASYINGYGWGTTREGKLTASLTNSEVTKPTYYNVGTSSLPGSANAMNASGSDVSTIYDYISTAYYGTRMNQTNDGYEWYPVLATDDKPVAVEEPEFNKSTGVVTKPGAVIASTDSRSQNNKRWRIHLRDGVVYRTGSTNSFTSKYDGTKVKLEDYLTPLKLMLTGWNAQYRGAELTDGISGFEGAATYYSSTSTGSPDDHMTGDVYNLWDDTRWNKLMGQYMYVGTEDDGRQFIEFTLLEGCTPFYAMYYLSSSLFSPLPKSFIEHWGGKKLGESPTGCKPVDTMLSTGPYFIEDWQPSKTISFKKNNQYFYTEDVFTNALGGTERRSVYNMPGICYTQYSSDNLAKEFLNGKTDSYAPKADELKTGQTFAQNSGVGTAADVKWHLYETKGSSNFKLNVNASDEASWLKRFGPNGSLGVYDTSTSTWTKLNKVLTSNGQGSKNPETACKPYMNNIHFLNFLSFAINRKEICEARGSTPTQEYFSDNYLIDPENGISYNDTAAHKAVLADRYNETYGFNETYAKSELIKAMDEVIVPLANKGAFSSKSGSSGAGTSNNPYLVPIDMEWMNTTDKTDYADVFTYITKIFAEVSSEDYNGSYLLALSQTGGDANYQQVYDKMKHGQFDLGFGSVSGNALNPLNFVEVLKSDNSSGFTLNWGPDTSVVGDGLYEAGDSRNTIVYDGKTWSFDGLWSAADTGTALTDKGSVVKVKNASDGGFKGSTAYQTTDASAKSVLYKISFKELINAGATKIHFMVSNASSSSNWKYYSINYVETGDGVTFTQLTPDSDGNINLTIGSEFSTSDGSSKEDTSNVTITFTYTVELKNGRQSDGNNTSTISKTFTSSMTLLTYYGVTYVAPSK